MLEGRILICKAKSILHPHSGWFCVSRASRAQQAKASNIIPSIEITKARDYNHNSNSTLANRIQITCPEAHQHSTLLIELLILSVLCLPFR